MTLVEPAGLPAHRSTAQEPRRAPAATRRRWKAIQAARQVARDLASQDASRPGNAQGVGLTRFEAEAEPLTP